MDKGNLRIHCQDNPTAAGKVISGIYEKAQLMSDFPEIGYKYREEPEGEICILLYGHYRIAYLITDGPIDILGVFHGALQIERSAPVTSTTIIFGLCHSCGSYICYDWKLY